MDTFNINLAPSFQDREYRDLPGSSSATVSFSSSTEIGFIHLDLSGKRTVVRFGYNYTMTEYLIENRRYYMRDPVVLLIP
jgi:hypothetical protein